MKFPYIQRQEHISKVFTYFGFLTQLYIVVYVNK